jgi:autotransporter-associated beta strand protein
MTTSFNTLRVLFAAALVLLAAQRHSFAGSATWATDPSSNDWNTATNWVPNTVPNSITDVATFGPSNLPNVSSANTNNYLDSAVFANGAPSYTITLNVSALFLYGDGIVNESGAPQSFVIPEENGRYGAVLLFNSATAGNMTSYSSVGGFFNFENSSSAGSATFDVSSGFAQASMIFWDSSTAGDATINASNFSVVTFYDDSTGGNSTFNLSSAAFASFASSNNAEHMTGTCIGGNQTFNSQIDFEGYSSAGSGTFTTIGGSTIGEQGSFILFDNTATADNATFVINGAMGRSLTTTELFFTDNTTAANASITANGGADGSNGGVIFFQKTSKGENASITVNGNAKLDITMHNAPGVTIGSLSGQGSVLLGTKTLTIGSNNQSTTYSGVIQNNGGVTKTGTGTLTLTGANSYTGTTTVSGGVLNVSNRSGSGTGTGAVNVNSGTLSGKGIIAGAITIGTGSGSAFLAPSLGSNNKQATLTIQSRLTFNSDATYTCTFRAKKNKAQSNEVIANGVTINSANINLVGTVQGRLRRGTVLTLISNTSATPISGAFSNLAEGAIVTVNGNNLQASYTGADGNDLTLIVVP